MLIFTVFEMIAKNAIKVLKVRLLDIIIEA
jgi:hypothetical protein